MRILGVVVVEPILLLSIYLFCRPLSSVLAVAVKQPRPSSLLQKWVSIVGHLQNPELYSVAWAENAVLLESESAKDESREVLVTKQRILAGHILSLVPIENLDLINEKDGETKNAGAWSFSTDLTRPHEYHRASGLTADMRVVVYPPHHGKSQTQGWLGHKAVTAASCGLDNTDPSVNCRVVPLLGALPLCALVATRDVSARAALVSHSALPDDGDVVHDVALQVLRHYTAEILELRSFLAMAHPFPPHTVIPSRNLPWRYHPIDTSYPGITSLHRDPDIWQIVDFFSPDECKKIIEYARPKLQPCLIKNAVTGRVESDPTRTSTNANIPQAVVPTVTAKVCRLLNCPSTRHLEIFQVLRYTKQQTFLPHTDGFDGPVDACGFEQSGRLVTLFCYLNTVGTGHGGETRFPRLDGGLLVAPVQGRAVVHFPNTLCLQEDLRTEHESVPMEQGEKWLFVTWCWKDARSDPAYHEALLS
eukprot:scaffold3953_cov169-Amphora_coffeaeformis.AAC.27